jgi:hypothetical protein
MAELFCWVLAMTPADDWLLAGVALDPEMRLIPHVTAIVDTG